MKDRVKWNSPDPPNLQRPTKSLEAEAVKPVLSEVDLALVMTVNPGFGGQRFIPEVLPQVATIRRWVLEDDLDVDIQVDGGISPQTIGAARAAGANVFVAGSAIFRSEDYKAMMMDLRH